MKHLTLLFALITFTLTANAQSLYFSGDLTGNGYNTVERLDVGVEFNLSDKTNLYTVTGYARNFTKGEYMHVGLGLQRDLNLLSIPLDAMVDLRGVFGQFETNKLGQSKGSEGGLAYSGYLGIQVNKLINIPVGLSVGSRLEQYVTVSDRIFINPVSLKVSF